MGPSLKQIAMHLLTQGIPFRTLVTGGITKFLKMENLEEILKVEPLLSEFFMAENFKESVIVLRFSQHFVTM